MARQADIGSGSYTVGTKGKLIETYRGYEIIKEHDRDLSKFKGERIYRFIIYGQRGIAEWSIKSLVGARAWIDATHAGKSGEERWEAVYVAEAAQ